MSNPFKRGDRVRVLNHSWVAERRGQVGTVVDAGRPGWDEGVFVRFEDGGQYGFYASSLEAIPRLTIEEKYGTAWAQAVEKAQKSRGHELAEGERMDEYGDPSVSFNRIADLWAVYLTGTHDEPVSVTPEDVALMMILLKISRRITDKKPDTLDDIEGYVSCLRMIEKETA